VVEGRLRTKSEQEPVNSRKKAVNSKKQKIIRRKK
jgi:hypothetical protein